MNHPSENIRSRRREQIIEAAMAVITAQGLQNLSLSEIEKQAGMSRGQLTYYFPTKEEILLAVFDRHLTSVQQRIHSCESAGAPAGCVADWLLHHLLEMAMQVPRADPELHVLQYTFLSQIGHREDFRERLARLHEEVRQFVAVNVTPEVVTGSPARPRVVASLVQAIVHGLAVQLAADPGAFDRQEMLNLCERLLGLYFGAGSVVDRRTNGPLAEAVSGGPASNA